MKVLTYTKTFLLSVALMHANSAIAAGWLSSYLPSWISKPIGWVGGFAAPFMPASIADAHKIKAPIEKDLTGAHMLLRASQEIRENRTFPKFQALNEDLEWLDRSFRKNKLQQDAFLEQQKDDLAELQQSQQTASENLKTTTAQVMALNGHFLQTTTSITAMGKKQDDWHNQINTNMASLKLSVEKDSVATAALIQESCNVVDSFDKQIELNLNDMNEKAGVGNKTLNDLSETDSKNSQNIELVIQKMEGISDAIERYAKRRAKKRELRLEKKKASGSSSALLNQASAALLHSLKNLNDK